MKVRWRVCILPWLVVGAFAAALVTTARAVEPIHVGFLWHMHQPRCIPGETTFGADSHVRFSVPDVHNQRFVPYTSWPSDAIAAGLGMSHLEAHVSFSGSLIENLNELEAANVNGGMWNHWPSSYAQARQWRTVEGNSRLDMIGFGYHHALMPLLDERDMRMQIKLHKQVVAQNCGSGVSYSRGFFPAETAFSERMIPALLAEGLEWSLVDNIQFDRASQNYPHTNDSGLFAPNRADQINPDPNLPPLVSPSRWPFSWQVAASAKWP